MTASNTQIIGWIGFSLHLLVCLGALVFRYNVTTTQNRLRLATFVLTNLIIAFYYGLNGASDVAGNVTVVGRVIDFARYWSYLPALALFFVFYSFSVNTQLGMALTLSVGGIGIGLPLAVGAWSVDVGVWYWFIPGGFFTLAVMLGALFFYGQTEEEANRITPQWHWAAKILFAIGVSTFAIFYLVDTPWTDAIKGDLVLMAAMCLVRDVLFFGVFGLIIFIWLDYYENMCGLGAIFAHPPKPLGRWAPLNQSPCDATVPLAPGVSPGVGNCPPAGGACAFVPRPKQQPSPVPATTGAQAQLSYPFGNHA